MKAVIGIDVGGSTTKIVGFWEDSTLIEPMFVRAADPVTSLYGAFGKFTNHNSIELEKIERIMVTGVGSTYITKPLYGLTCQHVPEFKCIGLGGLYLSGLKDAIVVSMGTGTAIIYAVEGQEMLYLGGTGVGGGTLMGLSKLMLGMDNIQHVVGLAEKGDLNKIDLMVGDITSNDITPGLPDRMTASNFGKISDLANKSDIAMGVINMVFETIGMMSIFAARQYKTRDIVLTGNLTAVTQSVPIFTGLNALFGYNFIIPDRAQFGPVIGAALADST